MTLSPVFRSQNAVRLLAEQGVWISPAAPRSLLEAAGAWGLPEAASRETAAVLLEPAPGGSAPGAPVIDEMRLLLPAIV